MNLPHFQETNAHLQKWFYLNDFPFLRKMLMFLSWVWVFRLWHHCGLSLTGTKHCVRSCHHFFSCPGIWFYSTNGIKKTHKPSIIIIHNNNDNKVPFRDILKAGLGIWRLFIYSKLNMADTVLSTLPIWLIIDFTLRHMSVIQIWFPGFTEEKTWDHKGSYFAGVAWQVRGSMGI